MRNVPNSVTHNGYLKTMLQSVMNLGLKSFLLETLTKIIYRCPISKSRLFLRNNVSILKNEAVLQNTGEN